jgi:hypothetical protein
MTSTPILHVLVIANETLTSQAVHDAITAHNNATSFLLVAPALNTRLRHWTSDDDRARAAAAQRLDCCIDTFDSRGLQVDGWVGDADPLQAVSDALVVFPADELIIATHPEHRSNWLAHDLVRRARLRFGLPVVHLVQPDQASLALAAAA